jgi:TM2 domain-containing membrane protein YozV
MTARTFGKKRLEGGDGGDGGDALAARREAFLAAERARADRIAESEVFSPAGSALRASFAARPGANDAGATAPQPAEAVEPSSSEPFVPLDRSLPVAYGLWLGLGLAGGHRFYLARPLTGAVQAALFIASVAAVALQYYPAFAGLFLCWLWFFIDGLRIKKMHHQVTGK